MVRNAVVTEIKHLDIGSFELEILVIENWKYTLL